MTDVFRFDHESFCVVFCRENSDVVQMTSNLADSTVATMYADGVRNRGGHVFKVVPAGVLVAAMELVKKDFEKANTAENDVTMGDRVLALVSAKS